MPSPTPIQIDYATLVFKPAFQGFINSIPQLLKFWYLWLFVGVVAVISLGIKAYQYYKLTKAGILDIDKMTGEEFEERLRILFTNLGYKAERTVHGSTKADYGVDLVVEINGTKSAVQAKCYNYKNDTVKESAIQAVYAGKNTYNCTEAIVITNSSFTKRAIALALADDVNLWNRDMLINVLLKEKSANNSPS
jgi:HJR/Mrr/RecB family endonuclease